MTMMLEYNLELFWLSDSACKCQQKYAYIFVRNKNPRGSFKTHLALPSLASVGWSEQEKVYLLSHGTQCILF